MQALQLIQVLELPKATHKLAMRHLESQPLQFQPSRMADGIGVFAAFDVWTVNPQAKKENARITKAKLCSILEACEIINSPKSLLSAKKPGRRDLAFKFVIGLQAAILILGAITRSAFEEIVIGLDIRG